MIKLKVLSLVLFSLLSLSAASFADSIAEVESFQPTGNGATKTCYWLKLSHATEAQLVAAYGNINYSPCPDCYLASYKTWVVCQAARTVGDFSKVMAFSDCIPYEAQQNENCDSQPEVNKPKK